MLRRLRPAEAAGRRPLALPPAVLERTREMLAELARCGEEALLRYSRELDGVDLTESGWSLGPADFEQAYRSLDPQLRLAMETAARRISTHHRAMLPADRMVQQAEGGRTGEVLRPMERVGVYVPGGSAPLFSSLLMGAIPAREAGVADIVAATPPRRDGSVPPAILAAAHLAGCRALYRIGGVQAIAALALGIGPVPAVEKIVGPGNAYVTAAKFLLSGQVGIDMLAGPSEVALIADASARPEVVAADLIAQAEHGRESAAYLITPDALLLERVEAELARQMASLPRRSEAEIAIREHGGAFLVRDLEEAVQVVNRLAPEHLGLAVEDPWALLPRITAAGAVFMGHGAGEAFGDYVAGPSHVLPTGGTARFSNPLGVETFLKRMTVIAPSPQELQHLLPLAAAMAEAEGLAGHARSLTLRLEGGEES